MSILCGLGWKGARCMSAHGAAALERMIRGDGSRAAFVPFVIAGDPTPEYSLRIIQRLGEFSEAIEVGIPYSDPLADGPVIQQGSLRALSQGMTMRGALALMEAARRETQAGLIAFTYVNPVIQFGYEPIAKHLQDIGADGILVPDLPFEESADLRTAAAAAEIAAIPLVSLTSGPRGARIAQTASGFVYCVSTLGVTGERSDLPPELEIFVRAVKTASPVPVAVGFGVSRPDQVAQLRAYADAVIVGSALVRRCGDIAGHIAAGDEAGAQMAFESLIAFARELSESGVRTGS